jgi:hypothetical protein
LTPLTGDFELTLSDSIHFVSYGFNGTSDAPLIVLDFFGHREAVDPSGTFLSGYNSGITPLSPVLQIDQPTASVMCVPELGDHSYQIEEFEVPLDGDYTFRFAGSSDEESPLEDSLLVVYDTFDPNNPDQGILGCNDDRSGEAWSSSRSWLYGAAASELTVHLEAASRYFLVTTTHDAVDQVEWDNSSSENYTWSYSEVEFSLEVWGPAGATFVYGEDLYLPTDEVTIDCESPSTIKLDVPVDAVVEVEILNCDEVIIDQNAGIEWFQEPSEDLLSAGTTHFRAQVRSMIDGDPFLEILLRQSGITAESILIIRGHSPVPDPEGQFLETERFIFPARNPDMARGNCLEVGSFPVSAIDFQPTMDGEYTFRVSDVLPFGTVMEDTVIAVYENYNPALDSSPHFACNDDRNGYEYSEQSGAMFSSRWSEVTAELVQDVRYTVVVSSYYSRTVAQWNDEELTNPIDVDVEIWGPANSVLNNMGNNITHLESRTVDCNQQGDLTWRVPTFTQMNVRVINCSARSNFDSVDAIDIHWDHIDEVDQFVNGDYVVWVDGTENFSSERDYFFEGIFGELQLKIEGIGEIEDPPGDLLTTQIQNIRRFDPPEIIGNCQQEGDTFLHAARRFSVDTAGLYTFRVSGVTGSRTPLRDTVLGIYEAFTPDGGGIVLGCNDDRDDNALESSTGIIYDELYSELEVVLEAGETYWLVVTPYGNMSAEEWNSLDYEGLVWDEDGVTVSTEMWGPLAATVTNYADFELPPPPTAPNAPLNLSAEVSNSNDVQISWDASDDGGNPIQEFILRWSESGEFIEEFRVDDTGLFLEELEAGNYQISVVARNLVGQSEATTIEFEVYEREEADTISWMDTHLKAFQQGRIYTDRVWALSTSPVSYSISAGALPNGLILDSSTGTISGTPRSTGNYSFEVSAQSVAGTLRHTENGRVRSSGPHLIGGQTPRLSPGTVNVTSDDRIDSASVNLSPLGQGNSSQLMIQAASGPTLYLGGSCILQNSCLLSEQEGQHLISAKYGGSIELTGSGLEPGSELTVFAFSTPKLLGSVVADSGGNYSITVPLIGLPAGQHTLQTIGIGQTGMDVVTNVGFVVSDDLDAGFDSPNSLSHTGSNTSTIFIYATFFVASGWALRLSSRRRRN